MGAIFSGCNPGGAPVAVPDGAIGTRPQVRYASSWMDQEASREDLLYAAASPNGENGSAYVYTYPKGRLLGTLTGFGRPFGECADSAGNVFIVAYAKGSTTSSTIYEYAHGGTSPVATLNDPKTALGCAVDPRTGDLAASGDGVAIFKNASGNPKMYYSSEYSFYYCGFDDRSNLYLTAVNGQYADQQVLVRLVSGSADFDRISLNTKLYSSSNIWPTVQWDGKHMAVTSDPDAKPISLYRLRITGSSATVISSATLSSAANNYSGETWIQGNAIIGVGHARRHYEAAFLWPYPKGGGPDRTIERLGKIPYPLVSGVTISVAHSR
jgi:hypothetical protein